VAYIRLRGVEASQRRARLRPGGVEALGANDSAAARAQRGLAARRKPSTGPALRLSPQHAPAAINLADLYRQLGRDSEGESVLRTAIELHYALGLTLTRLKRGSEAIVELQRATELEPDRARYQYVFAVALHSAGRTASVGETAGRAAWDAAWDAAREAVGDAAGEAARNVLKPTRDALIVSAGKLTDHMIQFPQSQ
jgi:tetratricopeptide (TPR) repeat protein